ncbi:hypothetical protein ILUMI_05465 [Ignelater luminosus]|uniref:mRNA export factor GLE1 n=1 Tax=Ignelater luminosus TaxID=2038154 RepID=A0A8K0DAG1_IGNLU|nr:hypothetical protein ILUMI_05465 [Ignelater luminosus]
MEALLDDFDDLKISALSKSKQINSFVKCTTIGPNSTCIEGFESQETTNTQKFKFTDATFDTIPIQHVSNKASVVDKYLAEIEHQRQGKVQEAVNSHLNCILEFSKKQILNSKEQLVRQQQILIEGMHRQELLILQALEQHDKDAFLQHQQLLQYYKELAEKRKQNNKELEERERRKQKINALIDSIRRDQLEFRNIYQQIVNVIKTCKFQGQLKDILGDVPKQLKILPDRMEEIINRCKGGKVSENESRKSSELVQEIKGLLNTIQQKLTELKVAEQVEGKTGKDILAVQPAPNQLQEQPVKSQEVFGNTTDSSAQKQSQKIKSNQINKFISKSSLRIYSELQDFTEKYVKAFTELENNNSYKQFRFDCKKAVNIPVNAISAVNTHHLLDKYNRLTDLLSGKIVEAGNTRVCASKHPQGVAFCMNLLAKKFVLQGDLMISSNPEAAFCYAAMIVALWHDYSDFGRLLLGHFYKQCPYLVPLYPPRAVGQSDKEFYLSQGYQYIDGVIEKQDKFLKRMTGIMRLFAAIIITKPKKGQQKNPYGLAEGWRWLASFLNLEPQPDITATMLHVFLEIAGSTLQSAFGKMFYKIMDYICNMYLPLIQKIDSGGPVTRLEVLLQEYQQRKTFDSPSGKLPANFW